MSWRLRGIVAAILLLAGTGVLLFCYYANREPTLPPTTDKELAAIASKMHGPLPTTPPPPQRIDFSHRLRLAIGSIGMANEQENLSVGDLVLAQLSGAKGLEMVERQALDTVLNELRLSLSGLVRAKDAVRAGKLLRADWFLLGTPAVVNGKPVAVIRLVDARTGILRDAAMIPLEDSTAKIASGMAEFVRQTRQDAATPKPKTYLAIGSFEDLSLNSRQATLPRELRSYLTASYRRSGVAMLEREFVANLLNETYLDLAGLTEDPAANAPAMQSGYWVVDGYYQSYETTQLQVELVLQVRRMFGRNERFTLREKPGEPLFRRVKQSIDTVMARDRNLLLSRLNELQTQLSAGSDLLDSVHKAMNNNAFSDWLDYTGNMPPSEVKRHQRNVQEAMRAFQTALLLDPTNRQARAQLASCLSSPFIGQYDQARDLYRELIDAPVADRWTESSKSALVWSFARFVSPLTRQGWFESAANRAANKAALEFFQNEAKASAELAILRKAGSLAAEKLAEERLFREIRARESEMNGHMFMVDFSPLDDFAETFGTNHALAAAKLVDLLPRLQAASSNLAPHLLAGVVTFQVDTNAPIIKEFERSLDAFADKPPTFFQPRYYVDLLASPVYRWAEAQRLYRLAARLKEIQVLRANESTETSVGDEDRVGLAFNYLRAEEWQKALDVFQSYSNRPVCMGNSGLWGPAFSVVLPGKQEALCRQKLGLPPVTDPREFDLGEPCLHLHGRDPYFDTFTFLTVSDGLWLGLNGDVMHVDFDLRTNFLAPVLPGGGQPVTALCGGDSKLWIGTARAGLVELDKTTHQTRHFTETDGLLMNEISALHLAGSTLWIGYGNQTRGAVGRLDLSSGRFSAFTASLVGKAGVTEPPARRVTSLQTSPTRDVWCMAGSALLAYHPSADKWEQQPARQNVWPRCYAIDEGRLMVSLALPQQELMLETTTNGTGPPLLLKRVMVCEEVAQFESELATNHSGLRVRGSRVGGMPEVGGLEIIDLAAGRRRRVLSNHELPGPATVCTLQGHSLWLGGLGFVALVDLNDNQIKRIAYVPARFVDAIQVGGGWLWVGFDKDIYRTAL